ncbi:MAG: hypothetical protein IT463_02340 [Planctomycetes bacterium]|nr:hypothetical protein [Planctomycetota bacterium]
MQEFPARKAVSWPVQIVVCALICAALFVALRGMNASGRSCYRELSEDLPVLVRAAKRHADATNQVPITIEELLLSSHTREFDLPRLDAGEYPLESYRLRLLRIGQDV